MVLPSSSSRVFYELMSQHIDRKINIYMGNIAVGSEYLPILRDRCISKVQIKVADTVSCTRLYLDSTEIPMGQGKKRRLLIHLNQ